MNRDAVVLFLTVRLIWRWWYNRGAPEVGFATRSFGAAWWRAQKEVWDAEQLNQTLNQPMHDHEADELPAPPTKEECQDRDHHGHAMDMAWGRMDDEYRPFRRKRQFAPAREERFGPLPESIGFVHFFYDMTPTSPAGGGK